MSPRYERLIFRLGLVGLVLVLAFFLYRTVIDPIGPGSAATSTTTTTTTEPGETTTTTTVAVTPKPFAIVSPRDRATVAQPNILLAGVGNPGAIVTQGEIATAIDARGVWSFRLPLVEGGNQLDLTETSTDGKVQTASITVIYQP